MSPDQARRTVCTRHKDPIEVEAVERFGPAVNIVVQSTGQVLATVYQDDELTPGELRDRAWQTAAFSHQAHDPRDRT